MDWSIEFVLVSIRSYSWFVTEGRDMIVITLHVFAVVRDTACMVDMENIEAQHWICMKWRCLVFIW